MRRDRQKFGDKPTVLGALALMLVMQVMIPPLVWVLNWIAVSGHPASRDCAHSPHLPVTPR